jgi:4'-phosphopantetheinyl transferase
MTAALDSSPSADVDVLLAALNCSTKLLSALTTTLSADETERASAFDCVYDRARFIASRGILRCILSSYVGRAPAEIRFSYKSGGKPELEQTGCRGGVWRFNLSHSGNAALYVVTQGRDVGVDIELIRRRMRWECLANRFFSPREVDKLKRWPAEQRAAAFFRCWTCKEAYLKAIGLGLCASLDQFEVSAGRDEMPGLLVAPDPHELQRWSFWDVPVNDRIAATAVIEGCPHRLRVLKFIRRQVNVSRALGLSAPFRLLRTLYPQERPMALDFGSG